MVARNKIIIFTVFILITAIIWNLFFVWAKDTVNISFYNNQQKLTEINAKIARTNAQKQMGLMFEKKLANNQGMIFVYEQEKILNFWMKNMSFDLDMIFLDSNKQIVSIIKNVPACRQDNCQTYQSEQPASYCLEVPAGFVDKHQINKKTFVNF